MPAIFDLKLRMTSDSIYTDLVVLPDGVVVGISMLSRKQAEMCVISYALPIHGGHLWFSAHPDWYSRLVELLSLLSSRNIGLFVKEMGTDEHGKHAFVIVSRRVMIKLHHANMFHTTSPMHRWVVQ